MTIDTMQRKTYNRIGVGLLKNVAQLPQCSVLVAIRAYQKTLSLDHGFLGKVFPYTRHCRFFPSCSQYTYEAVERFGVLKGLWLGAGRISRCHPWGPSGDNPVPEKLKRRRI